MIKVIYIALNLFKLTKIAENRYDCMNTELKSWGIHCNSLSQGNYLVGFADYTALL